MVALLSNPFRTKWLWLAPAETSRAQGGGVAIPLLLSHWSESRCLASFVESVAYSSELAVLKPPKAALRHSLRGEKGH
jgi:hypothetical protein